MGQGNKFKLHPLRHMREKEKLLASLNGLRAGGNSVMRVAEKWSVVHTSRYTIPHRII